MNETIDMPMASISLIEWLRLDTVAKAAKALVESVEPGLEPHTERVSESALTALESALDAAGYGDTRDEPPEDDGECFRGGEAAAYLAEQQEAARRLK